MRYFGCWLYGYKIWLHDVNAPLHVELSTVIESHFKCTIIGFKLIFRKNTTIFEFSWMYRISWLERNIKGSISSKGSLPKTVMVRKHEIFKSVSLMSTGHWIYEISREICLSSICSMEAVYLRWINTDKSLFVISGSFDSLPQVDDWNGV